MERMDEILKVVLSSNLLGVSIGEIAERLGYKGRSTLYRIINGKASERAMSGVCQRLNDRLYIGEDSLGSIRSTIVNTEVLSRLLRPLINLKDPISVQSVVNSFLSKDYSMFPEDFKRGNLPEILTLEQDDPDSFYNMLAYFYYKYSGMDYYAKEESHKERCSRVLESMGKRLIAKFPENDLATVQIYNYSKSEIFNSEAPILWSLIRTLSVVLQSYGRPIELLNDVHYLSLPHDRDYWDTGRENEVILTTATPTIFPENYSYDVFRIDMDGSGRWYLGSMVFLSDEILSFYSESQRTTKLGVYGFEGSDLYMGWEKPDDDPTTAGNKWSLLDKNCSQRLTALDKRIDEWELYSAKMYAHGFSVKIDYSVKDVIISREELTLRLYGGTTLTVALSKAPFLRRIRPEFVAGVFQRMKDRKAFVFWPQIMHCLPLEIFRKG